MEEKPQRTCLRDYTAEEPQMGILVAFLLINRCSKKDPQFLAMRAAGRLAYKLTCLMEGQTNGTLNNARQLQQACKYGVGQDFYLQFQKAKYHGWLFLSQVAQALGLRKMKFSFQSAFMKEQFAIWIKGNARLAQEMELGDMDWDKWVNKVDRYE